MIGGIWDELWCLLKMLVLFFVIPATKWWPWRNSVTRFSMFVVVFVKTNLVFVSWGLRVDREYDFDSSLRCHVQHEDTQMWGRGRRFCLTLFLIDFCFRIVVETWEEPRCNQKNDVIISEIDVVIVNEYFVWSFVCSFLGCFFESLKRYLVARGEATKLCLWAQKLKIFS